MTLDSVSVSGIVSSIISSIIVSLTGQLKMFEDTVSASLCEAAPSRNIAERIVHLGSRILLAPGMKRTMGRGWEDPTEKLSSFLGKLFCLCEMKWVCCLPTESLCWQWNPQGKRQGAMLSRGLNHGSFCPCGRNNTNGRAPEIVCLFF